MKTYILSDILSDRESIIPYSLKFAKHISERVSVLHFIDPRKKEAVSSAYADSQSFERGSKLSHEDILEREVEQAETALDKMLSSEASRLNYPLRVDTIVQVKNMREWLTSSFGDIREKPFFFASGEPDGEVIDSISELLETLATIDNHLLVIPPGYTYKKPVKCLMACNFSTESMESIMSVMMVMRVFELQLNLVDITTKKDHARADVKRSVWHQISEKMFDHSLRITSNILVGDDYKKTILNFVHRNNYDFVILPRQIKSAESSGISSARIQKKLMQELDVPVYIYS